MNAARTSAGALVVMALCLGLIYHAGPWPWMSRTLTVAGALAVSVMLQDALGTRWAATLAYVVAACALATLAAGLGVSDAWWSYKVYAMATVAAQACMTALWWMWWWKTGETR